MMKIRYRTPATVAARLALAAMALQPMEASPELARADTDTGHYFVVSRDNYKLHRRRLPSPEEQVTK
jgi:hypothetical protein